MFHKINEGDCLEKFINNFKKEDISSFSNLLNSLSPLEFISFGCIISIIITQSINPNEQNSIGNFLEMVGQILLTSYAQASNTIPDYIAVSSSQLKQFEDFILQFINKKSTN